MTKMKEKSFGELWELLDHCEKGSDEEFEIYKRMVELAEKEIAELEDDDEEDLLELPTGETVRCVPDYLDNYAGAMNNLSQIYINRKEYAKAFPLLEQVLPIYRTLESFDSDYSYQRVYATERMIECLKQLGKKNPK
jgi:tetratricopeptide (TPR) repeat protein